MGHQQEDSESGTVRRSEDGVKGELIMSLQLLRTDVYLEEVAWGRNNPKPPPESSEKKAQSEMEIHARPGRILGMGGAGICLQEAKSREGGGGGRNSGGFNPTGWIGRLKKAGSVLVAGDEGLAGVRRDVADVGNLVRQFATR
ncbi:hypothetical protein L2E82_51290 [Cichorium intybus]|nr:hypothetical protein L2E82_51290 [Cichorium intybus]